MRVTSAFLANYAEVRDGLAFVAGGFPEWWTVQSLPATATMTMVVVLDLDRSEVEARFDLDVVVERPDGTETGIARASASRGKRTDADSPIYVVLAVPVSLQLRTAGMHRFKVSRGEVLAAASLKVRLVGGPRRTD